MSSRFNPTDCRAGLMIPDLIVAATLTLALIGTLTTCTVRCGRLMIDTRHHQLALDELSNQLERLVAFSEQERAKAILELTPSDEVARVLSKATMAAETIIDASGTRIVLRLNWDRGALATPLKLTAWTKPQPTEQAP